MCLRNRQGVGRKSTKRNRNSVTIGPELLLNARADRRREEGRDPRLDQRSARFPKARHPLLGRHDHLARSQGVSIHHRPFRQTGKITLILQAAAWQSCAPLPPSVQGPEDRCCGRCVIGPVDAIVMRHLHEQTHGVKTWTCCFCAPSKSDSLALVPLRSFRVRGERSDFRRPSCSGAQSGVCASAQAGEAAWGQDLRGVHHRILDG